MFPRLFCAAALAAILWPCAAAAAPPLSLEQALDLALQRSQATEAARAAAAGAAERALAAGQHPDPVLAVGLDNLPATGPERFSTTSQPMTMKRIGISQEWVAADKRDARDAAARALAGREAVRERVAAAETRLQTALAYLDAYDAGQALELATIDEREANEALEAGRGRLATATGSSAEVLGLAGALGAAEDEVAEQRQRQAAAAAALERWIGVPPGTLAEPRLDDAPTLERFVDAHPRVVARESEAEVARQALAVAQLERRPNWTWSLAYGQRQGLPDLVSVGVRIPLPVAPAARQDRETAARQAALDQATAELEEARRGAAGSYATLAGDVQRLQARAERFAAAVLAPLQQRSAAALAAYRTNQAGLGLWFDARRAEVGAQRRLLSIRRDLTKARLQLALTPVRQPGDGLAFAGAAR